MRDPELSRRQRQCLEYKRMHMTAKEIGRLLNISHNTVVMHWRLAKLKLMSRQQIERGRRSSGQDAMPSSTNAEHPLPGLDWASRLAGTALFFAALLTALLILAVLSIIFVEAFDPDADEQYYGMFD